MSTPSTPPTHPTRPASHAPEPFDGANLYDLHLALEKLKVARRALTIMVDEDVECPHLEIALRAHRTAISDSHDAALKAVRDYAPRSEYDASLRFQILAETSDATDMLGMALEFIETVVRLEKEAA